MGSAEEADDAITAAEADDADDVDDDVGEKTRKGMAAAQVEAASAKEAAVEDSSPALWKEGERGIDDDDDDDVGGTEDEAEEEDRGVNAAGEISEEDSGELEGIVGVRERLR